MQQYFEDLADAYYQPEEHTFLTHQESSELPQDFAAAVNKFAADFYEGFQEAFIELLQGK